MTAADLDGDTTGPITGQMADRYAVSDTPMAAGCARGHRDVLEDQAG